MPPSLLLALPHQRVAIFALGIPGILAGQPLSTRKSVSLGRKAEEVFLRTESRSAGIKEESLMIHCPNFNTLLKWEPHHTTWANLALGSLNLGSRRGPEGGLALSPLLGEIVRRGTPGAPFPTAGATRAASSRAQGRREGGVSVLGVQGGA